MQSQSWENREGRLEGWVGGDSDCIAALRKSRWGRQGVSEQRFSIRAEMGLALVSALCSALAESSLGERVLEVDRAGRSESVATGVCQLTTLRTTCSPRNTHGCRTARSFAALAYFPLLCCMESRQCNLLALPRALWEAVWKLLAYIKHWQVMDWPIHLFKRYSLSIYFVC